MSTDNGTLPPHSTEAEAAALGCVLQDATLFSQLYLGLFYDHRHRVTFQTLAALARDNMAMDNVALHQRLRDLDTMDEAGGFEYVQALPDATPAVSAFPNFLETLRDRAARRAAIRDTAEVQRLANDPAMPAKAVAEACRRMGEAHAKNGKARLFTIRKPSEFVAMQFDDRDVILGDRLIATGQSFVIAAAGGIGKSRLLKQLAASITTGRKFLAFNTGGASLRWLILQTEDSNRRLHDDMARIQHWLGSDFERFDNQVAIHAIETDADAFVSLENPDNLANIAAAIEATKPDIIAIDPLNDFAIGDPNKDADMKATLQTLSRVCRKGNPHRVIVVLHHALTGRVGAAKATGYDRTSFARNSKALHAWARGQINLAPVDEDNNDRLIFACGKCSNGREFPAFGIRLDPAAMIYECDPTVDVKAWEAAVSNKAVPTMTPARVAELCRGPLTKADLAKAVMTDCGCVRQSAYRYVDKATAARKLNFNKASEHYTAK